IQANLEEGHLLPRTLGELTVHAERFVVAVKARKIVGCAELAPLSPHVAEVRSLAVDGSARGSRVGVAMVDELRLRARREAYEKRVGKECRIRRMQEGCITVLYYYFAG